MKPIPVAFHVGPLEIHTYGIGLALTFWFAYRYFAHRLRTNGYDDSWLGTTFVWIVVAAVVGARVVHVIANFGFYSRQPIEILAVWHGGLSSFGGLALAVPVGFIGARRRCPALPLGIAADLVGPVLVSAWAVGRLLGPQLMVAGGGKATNAWYGMYYSGQAGKRLPVPLFQAAECFVIYLIVIAVERAIKQRSGPTGVVIALTASLWGLSRFVDEYFWLTHDNGTDAVEIASVAFFAVGICWIALRLRRNQTRPRRDGRTDRAPDVPATTSS